jgi:hypothetical protein
MEEAGEHCAICVWKPIRMAQKTCISKTAGRLTQQDFKTFLINKMDSNAGGRRQCFNSDFEAGGI